jgi:hypothetical protein
VFAAGAPFKGVAAGASFQKVVVVAAGHDVAAVAADWKFFADGSVVGPLLIARAEARSGVLHQKHPSMESWRSGRRCRGGGVPGRRGRGLAGHGQRRV